jgi:hypothetical protein
MGPHEGADITNPSGEIKKKKRRVWALPGWLCLLSEKSAVPFGLYLPNVFPANA